MTTLRKYWKGEYLTNPTLITLPSRNPKNLFLLKIPLIPKWSFYLKSAFLKAPTAEQYNEMALEMFPLIMSELEGQFGNLDDRDLPILELLHSLICLAGHSISRMSNLHTAGLVSNKLEMRDKILLEFDHPAKTKNILRGSGFLSDNAFGPLPESLKTALASINGKEVMCRAKTGFTGTNVQTTTRGGYNNRGLKQPVFSYPKGY